jgi:DNA-binding NarL/FixJ family response regulator
LTSRTPIHVVLACRDANLAGALASLADPNELRMTQVASMAHLADASEKDDVGVVVVVDPEEFPPELVVETASSLPVLVVGPTADATQMIASVEAGALGYADAAAPLEELIEAIGSVAAGVGVIPPSLLGSLLRHVVERQRRQRQRREQLQILSTREREVFELTARGFDKPAVAAKLFISPATARTHVQNVFRKLSLHSLADLVALAAECGLEVGSADEGRSG